MPKYVYKVQCANKMFAKTRDRVILLYVKNILFLRGQLREKQTMWFSFSLIVMQEIESYDVTNQTKLSFIPNSANKILGKSSLWPRRIVKQSRGIFQKKIQIKNESHYFIFFVLRNINNVPRLISGVVILLSPIQGYIIIFNVRDSRTDICICTLYAKSHLIPPLARTVLE